MSAEHIYKKIKAKNPGFFEPCTDPIVLENEEGADIDYFMDYDDLGIRYELSQTFPPEIFPKDLSKNTFPSIDRRIDDRVGKFGIDVLAWYRSWHWNPPEKWGINIWASSPYYLAKKFDPNVKPSEFWHLVNMSFKLLVLHEYFHYVVDMAAAVLESANSFKKNLYAHYKNTKKSREESVANAWALRKDLSPYKSQVKRFMRSQPDKYTYFEEFKGQGFADGLREIGNLLAENDPGHLEPIEYIFKLDEKRKSRVPIRIVPTDEIPVTSPYFLGFAPVFSDIVESDTFQRSKRKISKGFPRIDKMITNAVDALRGHSSARGLGLKTLKGTGKIEVRLDRNYRMRASLNNSGQFVLEDVGKHKMIS